MDKKSKIFANILFVLASVCFLYFCFIGSCSLYFPKVQLLFVALSIWLSLNGFCLVKGCKYRFVKLINTIVICVFIVVCFPILLLICTPKIEKNIQKYPYVIVLGGEVRKYEIKTTSDYRLEKGIDYHNQYPESLLVFSGVDRIPFDRWISSNDNLLNGQDYLDERWSKNTVQNLTWSCQKITKETEVSKKAVLDSDVAIITNRFHLRRAEIIANRLGYTKVHGIVAPMALYDIPGCYLKEVGSYIKLGFNILFKNEPKKLIDS